MVDYIKYKGESYPIKISFKALNDFEKETGKVMSEIGEALATHEIICWFGLVAGHRMDEKELKLTREDVEWILDESLGTYQKIFMDSMVKLSEELSGTPENKKK